LQERKPWKDTRRVPTKLRNVHGEGIIGPKILPLADVIIHGGWKRERR